MYTRELIGTDVDNLEEADTGLSASNNDESTNSCVTQADVEEYEKFKEHKREFKAEFAKFKLYRQLAREMDEAAADNRLVNSSITP